MSELPDIRINNLRRYPSLMAIPRAHETPPPPLPPPTCMPDLAHHDPGWQWGNDPNGSDFGKAASVKTGSNFSGANVRRSFARSQKEQEHFYFDMARRGSSMSSATITGHHQDISESASVTPSDGDCTTSRPLSNYRLHGERQLEQRTLEASSNTYDKHLLSRIGGPNGPPTPKRSSLSYSSTGSVQETAQLAHAEAERRSSQLLRSLSMPQDRNQSSSDSPASARWPSSGAISPGFTGFWEDQDGRPSSQSQTRHNSLTFNDSISQRGSYDHSMFSQEDLAEESPMRDLNLHDQSPRTDENARIGTKRRASSPPRDPGRASISSASAQSEIYHRRSIQQLPRTSPVSRFHPNHSSVSSSSSCMPRHGSMGSSLGVASIPSSATSLTSGRLSPNALSHSYDFGTRMQPPPGPNVKTLNPNSTVEPAPHQRSLSQTSQSAQAVSPTVSVHSRANSVSQLQGVFMCECCPKKPKKFDSAEELRQHESEKQYICAYCPNRFKNKNEAERHQNSLHLRKHSWSCAALAGAEAAFHASPSGSGCDVCGYCGEEFPNPPQWDLRADHLNRVHKFGECNQAKKFFRADHFRQHLKHSHQGTSGKWTNMLELACMKDEPLPEKRAVIQTGQVPLPALMVSTAGLSSDSLQKRDEAPLEIS